MATVLGNATAETRPNVTRRVGSVKMGLVLMDGWVITASKVGVNLIFIQLYCAKLHMFLSDLQWINYSLKYS